MPKKKSPKSESTSVKKSESKSRKFKMPKSKKYKKLAERKIEKSMGEFKEGDMHARVKGTGPVVKNPKQAIAISLSVAERAVKKAKKRKAKNNAKKSKK